MAHVGMERKGYGESGRIAETVPMTTCSSRRSGIVEVRHERPILQDSLNYDMFACKTAFDTIYYSEYNRSH